MPATAPEKQTSVLSLVVTGVLVLAAVFGIRMYMAKPFIVSGVSMYPTFDSWHYLIIDELTYNFIREPERGEVVVLRYPADPSRYFIKRVIGLPGETVELAGTSTYISNSQSGRFALGEGYVPTSETKIDDMTVALGPTEYFVMGDNRAESADSRFFGPLERHYIVGRALVRLFPFTKMGFLPGQATYTSQQ